MKVNVTKIDGYSEMSAEDKVKALEGFDIEVPQDGEKAKLKAAIDKATAEASEYKKKWQNTLSEQERLAAEQAEKDKARDAELKAYKDKERISNYKAKFMEIGYDAATAQTLASSLPEGINDDFFSSQKIFLETQKQQQVVKAIDNQPNLSAGLPNGKNPDDDKLRKYMLGNT